MAERIWDFAVARCRVPGVTSMVGYRGLAVPEDVHRGLPSSRLTLILSLDDGVEAAADAEGLAAARPNPVLLAGLHQRSSWVRQRRHQAGVQLALHPLAARMLLGVPAAELSVTDFAGADVLGRPASRLVDRLSGLDGSGRPSRTDRWADVFALVQQHLQRRLRPLRLRPELLRAWQLLERSGGRVPVAEVARQVSLTPRHLGTLFEREVGRSPKQVAMLVRFERTSAALAADARRGDVDLAGLAARTGYSDQSHLHRDFVRFAGLTPTAWVGEELRNIQDGGHDR